MFLDSAIDIKIFFKNWWADVKTVFQKELWLLGSVFFFLALCSIVTNLVFHALTCHFLKRGEQKFIDGWHLCWLVGSSLLLFFCAEISWILAFLPMLKLFDLFYTLLMLMVLKRRSKGAVRPLVHLALHYMQLVVAFACLFLSIQQRHGHPLFLVDAKEKNLTAQNALYISLITAATVGYGDVTPQKPSSFKGPWYYQPTLYVGLEILAVIGLTLLFIPYFVSAAFTEDTNCSYKPPHTPNQVNPSAHSSPET